TRPAPRRPEIDHHGHRRGRLGCERVAVRVDDPRQTGLAAPAARDSAGDRPDAIARVAARAADDRHDHQGRAETPATDACVQPAPAPLPRINVEPSPMTASRASVALACVAAPCLASLLDGDIGDEERGYRVKPPRGEYRVADEAEKNGGGEIGAEHVL